jgi:hypothetical protein
MEWHSGEKANARVMKAIILFLGAALMVLSGGCASDSSTKAAQESVDDLGFGFRRVTMTEPVKSSFESKGHFQYFYYGKRRLCQLGTCSVSPSGRFAVYQDGPSGALFLFRRADHKSVQLTSTFISRVQSFDWHEGANSVEARYEGGNSKSTFMLE